jgi:EAL domain-containing protein (putative c-di-GMP-specific phosphodiesterase class I)/FixJ family two-component response regulator/GGDEF domain-containing protein
MTLQATRNATHRILVVEDDAPSRALLVRRLRREGWDTCEAPDGPSALALLEQEAVSAVLLDIGLPGMDGLSVLRTIRLTRPAAELPVLMVTAFDAGEHLAGALEAGANDFVNKPIDFPILRARLRTHLHVTAAIAEADELRERQALILKGSNDGIWEWDLRGDHLVNSARWNERLALPPSDSPSSGEDWFKRIHANDRARVEAEFQHFLDDSQAEFFRSEYRLEAGDDDYLWVQTRGAAQRDGGGTCLRLAGTHTDISALRYVNRFTGLPNLQRVTDMLGRHADRVRQTGGNIGIVFLWLWDPELQTGHMRERHAASRQLANALNRHLQPFDIIGSGEHAEHLILIPGQTLQSTDELMQLAQRALEAAGSGLGGQRGRHEVRMSAGIAFFPDNATPAAEEIIAAAHLAAQTARERGVPVLHFDSQLRSRVERHHRLATELAEAIDSDAIMPWWQPIIHADGRLAGFETLARWQHSDGSFVPPDEFIPLAEATGQIRRLTDRLLERSLAALSAWRRAGKVGGDAYVAINFTSTLVEDPGLPERLHAALIAHGLQPGDLCIEVTESAAVSDTPETRVRLQRLRQDGFRLALDDFGTGYASLSMLHRLPFDTLKIDQSFVRVMLEQPNVYELVHAIIAMARALDLKLIAEGVETEPQAHRLREAGVDRLQGYLHARPMPEATLLGWLQGNHSCAD